MAKIDLPKWSGKRSKVRKKSVKSQGILKRILSGNPDQKHMLIRMGQKIRDLACTHHCVQVDSIS